MGVPLPTRGSRLLAALMGSVPLVLLGAVGLDGPPVEGPSVGVGYAVAADIEKAAEPDDAVVEIGDGFRANMRSSSSPSLSLFATGSSAVSSSCGRFTPWRTLLIVSLSGSVVSIKPLSKSSGGIRSFCDGCDDGCDERNEERELAVACRANDGSGSREDEARADGERERLPVLRPLRILVRTAGADIDISRYSRQESMYPPLTQ